MLVLLNTCTIAVGPVLIASCERRFPADLWRESQKAQSRVTYLPTARESSVTPMLGSGDESSGEPANNENGSSRGMTIDDAEAVAHNVRAHSCPRMTALS